MRSAMEWGEEVTALDHLGGFEDAVRAVQRDALAAMRDRCLMEVERMLGDHPGDIGLKIILGLADIDPESMIEGVER